MRRAVFLDLNGTLVMPILVEALDELRLITGAGPAIARLSGAGFVCPVVTIQSRIAKRKFSMETSSTGFAHLARNWQDMALTLPDLTYAPIDSLNPVSVRNRVPFSMRRPHRYTE